MRFSAVVTCALISSAALAQFDGVNIQSDAALGGYSLLATQNTQTQFGNAAGGSQNSGGGSELNGMWAGISGGNLLLSLSGNLEANFNKMWIFLDARVDGENVLDNLNQDGGFNEIQNFAGMRFDAGFSPETALRFEVGDGFLGIRYADLASNVGGDILTAGGTGSLPLNNAVGNFGVTVGWDNTNGAGVDGGNGFIADPGVALTADTGFELSIPLNFLGEVVDQVCIAAMISNGDGGFLSNQVLPGIGGGDNLGFPGAVDFHNIAGDQFACIPEPTSLGLLLVGVAAGLIRRR